MLKEFSGQNLRGRSFKGQNLAGANFSRADLRGTNFTGANLRGANFTGAKAGLKKRWAIFLVIIPWLVSGLSGLLFLFNAGLILLIFDSSSIGKQVAGWTALIVTIIIFALIVRQRIAILVVALAVAFAVTGAANVAFGGVATAASVGVLAVAFAVAGVGSGVVATATTGIVAGAGTVVVDRVVVVAVVVVVAGARALAATGATTRVLAVSFAVAGAGTVISSYIAWRAMKGDKKYALIRNATVGIAAIGGTSFRDADLTDANFTAARLKSTDLRNAKLIRTCFHNTELLDRVRPGNSYLQHCQIRELILTGQGQNKNFNRLNLRGINLKGANLVDASFRHTDLTQACLEDADLSRSKLVKTQLDNTDFTGATLTGAYIHSWNITSDTNFKGVRCKYVYMRLPTKEKPDPLRKPDNNAEVFADGEFGDFIQPIFDTLDLYHNQGVDPRAIAISFKELAENNPDAELEIVAMERRGKDKFLLRAKTAQEGDKSQLSAEYFEIYNHVKALAEKEVKALIAEKDKQIYRLENMVMTALERPNFYSNTSVEKVDNMNNQPGGISQNMSGGTMHGGMQAAQGDHNKQTMDTNVVSPSQKQTLAEAAAEIQALLEQLEKSYPTDTTTGKMALAMEAIAQIDSNSTLTARILSALQVGSFKAFEQFLNHPAASFVIGALEDWQKTKGIESMSI